ncbi:COPII coat Sec23p-Sfb3p heterodimer component [Microbotryomycetes sp. JL221]|nr:COPII coat Sec23p-Sfb3p heterodimer component [Microbotryomycetes sp. JL221]
MMQGQPPGPSRSPAYATHPSQPQPQQPQPQQQHAPPMRHAAPLAAPPQPSRGPAPGLGPGGAAFVTNGHAPPSTRQASASPGNVPRVDQLAQDMRRVELHPQQQQPRQPLPLPSNPNGATTSRVGQPPQPQPQPLPPPSRQDGAVSPNAPRTTKRSARAYHQPMTANQPAYDDEPQRAALHPQQQPLQQHIRGPSPAYDQQQQQQQHQPPHQQQQPYPHQQPPQPYPHSQLHHPQQPEQQPPQQHPPPQQQPLSPSAGIPQPPHSAGQRIPGKMRVRIDPDHIPSPVTVQQVDQALYKDEAYLTCSRTSAPLSTTDFIAIDQGNCNPRFLRMTTYNLPNSDDLTLASQIPLGLIVQPFAQVRQEEQEVPVVDFSQTEGGQGGPPRCQRCRGYINPWCLFIEGGQKFLCNLCGATTEVAPSYFSHLDMSQRRMDLDQRPELRLGSIDFIVGKDYWVQKNPTLPTSEVKEPVPLNYVFAIDVSWTSMRCGLVQQVVKGLRELLYPETKLDDQGQPQSQQTSTGILPGCKIGIITFDKTVNFFNLRPGLDQAQMLVVPDIDDMFLPMMEGFLVDPIESRSVIESLFESLPNLTADTSITEAAIGGPVRAAMLALKPFGGQINLFQTSLPTFGPGSLKHREDNKLYGTDKEKTLFVPQDPWYRQTAEECTENGIGINMFLFPTQYIDVATLASLPGMTGGELYFHPRFDPIRDGKKLRNEISRVVTRETGYSTTMRIRCSNGLRVAEHYGNFFQRNVTDLEFGMLDSDKAIGARLKHEGKLDDKSDAFFQCAVLYTSASGQRRVRVHNLAVPVTTLLANVFRYADMDTTIAHLAKEAVSQTNSKTLRQIRDNLTSICVKALLAYRKHCASSTSPAQLILPESYKLFPLYTLALIKSKALKGGPVASDVRMWHTRLIKSASVSNIVGLLYPRMLPIHMLSDESGFPDERGRLRMPPLIRTSYARMEPHGCYLIENGELAILWIGQAVSPQILQDLYAVDSLEQLDTRMSTLPELPTLLSTQVRNILASFEMQRGGKHLPVLIARQNIDGTEIEFSNMLVEDSNNEQLSYVDSLCHIHSLLQSELMVKDNKPARRGRPRGDDDDSRSRSRSSSLSLTPSPRSRSPPPTRTRVRRPLPRTIKVGRLTKNVTIKHLDEIFGAYGKIVDIDLPILKALGTHKGTAWIEFSKALDAEKAEDCMDGGFIDGEEVTVKLVEDAPPPPPPPPRRLSISGGGGTRRSPPPRAALRDVRDYRSRPIGAGGGGGSYGNGNRPAPMIGAGARGAPHHQIVHVQDQRLLHLETNVKTIDQGHLFVIVKVVLVLVLVHFQNLDLGQDRNLLLLERDVCRNHDRGREVVLVLVLVLLHFIQQLQQQRMMSPPARPTSKPNPTSPMLRACNAMAAPGHGISSKPKASNDEGTRIAYAFLDQYYNLLFEDPGRLHCFYRTESTLIHSAEGNSDNTPHYGQQGIHDKLMSLGYNHCKSWISTIDSQPSSDGGIMVMIIGWQSNASGPWRKFSRTFYLASQPNGYFVLNDICRLLDPQDDGEDASIGLDSVDTAAAVTQLNQTTLSSDIPTHVESDLQDSSVRLKSNTNEETHQQQQQQQDSNLTNGYPQVEQASTTGATPSNTHVVTAAPAINSNNDVTDTIPATNESTIEPNETESVMQDTIEQPNKSTEVTIDQTPTTDEIASSSDELTKPATTRNETASTETDITTNNVPKSELIEQVEQTNKVKDTNKTEQASLTRNSETLSKNLKDDDSTIEMMGSSSKSQNESSTSSNAISAAAAPTSVSPTITSSSFVPTSTDSTPVTSKPTAPKSWASLAASNTNKWSSAIVADRNVVSSNSISKPLSAAHRTDASTSKSQQQQQQQNRRRDLQSGSQKASSSSSSTTPLTTTTTGTNGQTHRHPTSLQPNQLNQITWQATVERPLSQEIKNLKHSNCFVKGVQENISNEILIQTLNVFGKLKEFDLIRSKACAFVEFENLNSAKKIIQASLRRDEGGDGGIVLGPGMIIHVVEKKSKDDRPPSKPRQSGVVGNDGLQQQQQQQHRRQQQQQQQQQGGQNQQSSRNKQGGHQQHHQGKQGTQYQQNKSNK